MQLLEQAARLLYKEWFVHLRFPGHEHVKINDGVPEGWEKKTTWSSVRHMFLGPRHQRRNMTHEALVSVINQKCIRNGLVDHELGRSQSRGPDKIGWYGPETC